jgi:beta-glucanase (GH16 family)
MLKKTLSGLLILAALAVGQTSQAPHLVIDNFERDTLPFGQDPNGIGVGYVAWNHPSARASIALTKTPPAQPPGFPKENTVLKLDLTIGPGQWAGFSHAFTNDQANAWLSQDWSGYEGITFWLYGNNTGGTLFFDIIENRNPGSTRDDAERWSVDIPDTFTGWKQFSFTWDQFHRKEIGNGAPNDGLTLKEVHGYAVGGFGTKDMGSHSYYVDHVALFGTREVALQVAFAETTYRVQEGQEARVKVALTRPAEKPVSVRYRTAESLALPGRDFTPIQGTLTLPAGQTEATLTLKTFDTPKHEGNRGLILVLYDAQGAELGAVYRTHVVIEDDEAEDPLLLEDFEGGHGFEAQGPVVPTTLTLPPNDPRALPGQQGYEGVLQVNLLGGPAGLLRRFAEPRDFSQAQGLSFWFYGTGSGKTITLELLDNPAKTTEDLSPTEWQPIFSEEFDGPSGTPPDPARWTPQIGDGTLYGIPGWGNAELQYYTDKPENAQLDGQGNLVLSLKKAQEDLACWYGPCQYTSARLVSAKKLEVKYGRIEARIRVPDGPAGLWPAFWMLGSDIDRVGWPECGEIDIMEYVSRMPNSIFGTLHGPGYSGGEGKGKVLDLGRPVYSDYHVFAVEWEPGVVRWYLDGQQYFQVTSADVAPNRWVFDKPFFLILNMAIGGNLGGPVATNMPLPQELKVDYIRVYGAPDTAERFEASFVDDFTGWKQITLPFTAFRRSSSQPDGAPDDGLTLTRVMGYGFRLPEGLQASFLLDQIRLY